jgi:pantoate--beta-alanine ligase
LITVETITALREARATLPAPIGLVPTMGYLHEGHLSLVEQARAECAAVVVSIFVNPTQFGPKEDLTKYPRDIPRDVQLLERTGADLVWIPTAELMYPPDYQTWVNVGEVTKPLEGVYRPGHFRGVTTIVAKLFNAVQPHKAYFGQKDAQQAVTILRMVRDLVFPVEIIVCPTVREVDGLAMSSRNVYLEPQERTSAPVLFRALTKARDAFYDGERRPEVLRDIVRETIQGDARAKLQYVSCADPGSFEELEGSIETAIISVAVLFGKTRLIDNIILGD